MAISSILSRNESTPDGVLKLRRPEELSSGYELSGCLLNAQEGEDGIYKRVEMGPPFGKVTALCLGSEDHLAQDAIYFGRNSSNTAMRIAVVDGTTGYNSRTGKYEGDYSAWIASSIARMMNDFPRVNNRRSLTANMRQTREEIFMMAEQHAVDLVSGANDAVVTALQIEKSTGGYEICVARVGSSTDLGHIIFVDPERGVLKPGDITSNGRFIAGDLAVREEYFEVSRGTRVIVTSDPYKQLYRSAQDFAELVDRYVPDHGKLQITPEKLAYQLQPLNGQGVRWDDASIVIADLT